MSTSDHRAARADPVAGRTPRRRSACSRSSPSSPSRRWPSPPSCRPSPATSTASTSSPSPSPHPSRAAWSAWSPPGCGATARGPVVPLLASMALFSLGLLVCGLAPDDGGARWSAGSSRASAAARSSSGSTSWSGLVYPTALRPAIFASFAAAWVLPALFGPGAGRARRRRCGAGAGSSSARSPSWRWSRRPARPRRCAVSSRTPRAPPTPRVAAVVGGARRRSPCSSLELLGSARGLTGRSARSSRSSPSVRAAAAAPDRHAARAARAAVGDRHPRPAQRGLLLRRGLHRLRPAGALGPEPRPRRHRAHLRRRDLGDGQPGAVAARQPGLDTRGDAGRHVPGAGRRHRRSRSSVLLRSRGAGPPALLPAAAYVLAGAGMGFAYPRTSVAMLEASTDRDRGFNSSALSVADSLGAALALSIAGSAFAVADARGRRPVPVGLRLRGRGRCSGRGGRLPHVASRRPCTQGRSA